MTDKLVYAYLNNGIHQFCWLDTELDTISAYVKIFFERHIALMPDSTMCILHDYRNTVAPSLNVVANLMKSFKFREDISLRVAYLYSDSLFPIVMKNVSTFAPSNTARQFFEADKEQEAIDWLLAELDSE